MKNAMDYQKPKLIEISSLVASGACIQPGTTGNATPGDACVGFGGVTSDCFGNGTSATIACGTGGEGAGA